jgi:crossover junction endodeoxyribonuclease RusA
MTITLPLPPKALHPNGRTHHYAKARAVKKYRQMALVMALSILPAGHKPRHRMATAIAHWYAPTNNLPDGDNANASLKAAYDGIADSGYLDNDRGLTHLPVVFHVSPKNPRVEITITVP